MHTDFSTQTMQSFLTIHTMQSWNIIHIIKICIIKIHSYCIIEGVNKTIKIKDCTNVCKSISWSPNNHYSDLNHVLLLYVIEAVVAEEMTILRWATLVSIVVETMMRWINSVHVEATMSWPNFLDSQISVEMHHKPGHKLVVAIWGWHSSLLKCWLKMVVLRYASSSTVIESKLSCLI